MFMSKYESKQEDIRMAQVSVTHLRATTPEFRREFHDRTRISVGIHLFGLEPEAISVMQSQAGRIINRMNRM